MATSIRAKSASKPHTVADLQAEFKTDFSDSADAQNTLKFRKKLRLGELFAGAGGMALGASIAEHEEYAFEHVWAIDNDRDSCRTLQKNGVVRQSRIHMEDVRNINFGDLPGIDGLVFGFPCNDFSVVGERRGIEGDFGGLYTYGVKALNAFNPSFFVAENVSGLSSVNSSSDFKKILSELESAGQGYTVVPHLYKFEEYGVPQNRHRYIIVGFRSDLGVEFEHPWPTYDTKTARDALANIPEGASNHELTVQSETVVERLSHIKPGQNAFTADLPAHLQLNMRSGAKISQIYRRLLPDEPAYTVTGSGGGGTHIYHWDETRALTNRERARLQTFPDSYTFVGGKESVRRQVGMALPPQGAKIVFEAVLDHLATMKHTEVSGHVISRPI